MSRIFETGTDPLGSGRRLYNKKSFEIKEGITVLVGCNGAGKTSLLNFINDYLRKNYIPCIKFDNLSDGGNSKYNDLLNNGHLSMLATMVMSSEGENIMNNVSILASKFKTFMVNGHLKEKFEFMWSEEQKQKCLEKAKHKERWLLFDATDSGLSIDNIIELKDFFRLIIRDFPENEVYILVTANEYEMSNGEDCLDIQHNKYVRFNNYEEYRDLIMKSREIKDKYIKQYLDKKE